MIRRSLELVYVSGTRADFGLMRRALLQLAGSGEFQVAVAVTGMHLDPAYGLTVGEIEASGLPICLRIPTVQGARDGLSSSLAMADAIRGFSMAWSVQPPDAVLLLGDRGEMLAGALAAAHLGLPIIHIHGGERSGTLDEPVRHAISKLATLHWPATEESRERLIRMGEAPSRIRVVGAPGLDGIEADAQRGQEPLDVLLRQKFGAVPAQFVLALMHPEAVSASAAQEQTRLLAEALEAIELPVVWLKPNSDSGSAGVLAGLSRAASERLHIVTHLERPVFCAAMARAALMIGNSSSGIIEAASFGTPVVNLGVRQSLRQRNLNVRDLPWDGAAIRAAVSAALQSGRSSPVNVYGDGRSGDLMLDALRHWLAHRSELSVEKANTY